MRPLQLDGADRAPGRRCRGTGATRTVRRSRATSPTTSARCRATRTCRSRRRRRSPATCAPGGAPRPSTAPLAGARTARTPAPSARPSDHAGRGAADADGHRERAHAPRPRSLDPPRRDAERMGFFTDTTTASAARRARSPASSGTTCPSDGGELRQAAAPTTTPGELSARRPGATCASSRCSSRSPIPAGRRGRRCPTCVSVAPRSRRPRADSTAGCSCPTSASTARTPAAWTRARPARSIRTEFDTVIVQPDVCNGCGYCIPSCPFGVIDRDHDDGRAAKCTLCYDRLQDGLEPACAKACPTDSIQFGPYDELVELAAAARGDAARARHRRRLPVRRRRRARGRSWPAASARSSC